VISAGRAALLLSACALAAAGCATTRSDAAGPAVDPALERQLARAAEPADGPRYVFVGVAMSDRSPAFYGDIRIVDRILGHHYGPAYRSVLLSNQEQADGSPDLPRATPQNVDVVVQRLRAFRKRDDRFILLFTSHGTRGALAEQQRGARGLDGTVQSDVLGRWVKALAPNRTWVMISACYSGSHLDQVMRSQVVAMTASDADHSSLGCGTTNRTTYFVGALAQSLDFDQSFAQVWRETERRIGIWEKKLGYEGAHPQLRFGEELAELEDAPLSQF
jgi:hypothetical protein